VHDWWAATDPNDGVAIKTAFDPAAGFHNYGLLWTPDSIIWYIDGVQTRSASLAMAHRYRDLAGPMYLCFNIAMGGGWAGPAGAGTTAQMEIDWVRVKSL
jgi:beta-glucanase (GH16 family)